MSNREEAVFAMITATSIGAIWVGILPLMGPQVRFTICMPLTFIFRQRNRTRETIN